MKLLIGNKNYSSWSLRPWLVLRYFEIEFEEELLLLNGPDWKQKMLARTPAGYVPVLEDIDLVSGKAFSIGETLAIIEYAQDKFPHKSIWPKSAVDRALARAAAAEMHAGFSLLRNAAPMNLRASHPGRIDSKAIAPDMARLETLLGGLLERSGGPFLFGAFCAADAMFAPVMARIRTYHLPVSPQLAAYGKTIFALSAFRDWYLAALEEEWIVDMDEIDIVQDLSVKG